MEKLDFAMTTNINEIKISGEMFSHQVHTTQNEMPLETYSSPQSAKWEGVMPHFY